MRAKSLAPVLLALAVLAAGCVGKSPEKADEPTTPASSVDVAPGPTAEEIARTPGSIRGFVLAPDLTPVGGAKVTLLRENVSRATTAAGGFLFEDLKNGRYLVRAEKEGWYGKTAAATVRNGTVYEINFTLERIPVVEPYHETVELKGLLACEGLVTLPVGTTPVACGEADPNLKREWEVHLNADRLAGLVVELVWEPGTPLANRLNLTLETVGYGSSDLTLAATTAEGGYSRLVVTGPVLQKYYPQGGTARASTRIAPTADGAPADAALAFQQQVTVYATAFYHAPPPDAFTVVQG